MNGITQQFPLMFAIAAVFQVEEEEFPSLLTNGNRHIPGTNLELEDRGDGRLLRLNNKDVSLRESKGAIFVRCHTITLAAMPGAELPEATSLLLNEFIAQSDDPATVAFIKAIIHNFPWGSATRSRLKVPEQAEEPAKRAA